MALLDVKVNVLVLLVQDFSGDIVTNVGGKEMTWSPHHTRYVLRSTFEIEVIDDDFFGKKVPVHLEAELKGEESMEISRKFKGRSSLGSVCLSHFFAGNIRYVFF
jgi:hypothetical protein